MSGLIVERTRVNFESIIADLENDQIEMKISIHNSFFVVTATVENDEGFKNWNILKCVNLRSGKEVQIKNYNIYSQIISLLDVQASSWYIRKGFAS